MELMTMTGYARVRVAGFLGLMALGWEGTALAQAEPAVCRSPDPAD